MRPGVFSLMGMLVHRGVTPPPSPQELNSPVPFYTPGRESHCESKVSCPRTQDNVLDPGLNPEASAPTMSALTNYSLGHSHPISLSNHYWVVDLLKSVLSLYLLHYIKRQFAFSSFLSCLGAANIRFTNMLNKFSFRAFSS